MENIKEYVIGFVECTVDYREFVQKVRADSEILDWLQSIVPEGLTCHKYTFNDDYILVGDEIIPYDIRVVTNFMDGSENRVLDYALNLQGTIHRLLVQVFPNESILKGSNIGEISSFISDACPSYIGGIEVEDAGIFEILLDALPKDAPKKQQTKFFKDRIMQMFHIDGKNYPRWINEPDWPVSPSGIPLRFIGQKKKKGIEYDTTLYTEYYFEDVDTGEKRVVSQFT